MGAFDSANKSDKSECGDCGKPTISPHTTSEHIYVLEFLQKKKQFREQCETVTNGSKSKTSALTRIRANIAKVKADHGLKHHRQPRGGGRSSDLCGDEVEHMFGRA